MESRIKVENIRCGGCANSIRKKLSEDSRIDSIEVDIEQQTVIISTENDDLNAVKEAAVQKLLHLGYPKKGSVEGLQALKGKAKSMVSCTIGRVS